MDQTSLLKLIAETGYNVGYAAKKHLATFDMVEKLPGWVGLLSTAAGIYALFVPALEQKPVAAAFLVMGIASMFLNFYSADKDKYAHVGGQLTGVFHELRTLYYKVKAQPAGANLTALTDEHTQIQARALQFGIAKQIFLSDWYAHYKFFWQAQIGWIDEQLKFSFLRDKLPLGFTMTLMLLACVALYFFAPSVTHHFQNFCTQ